MLYKHFNLLIFLLLLGGHITHANPDSKNTIENTKKPDRECCDERTVLKVFKLCAEKIKADKINVRRLCGKDICGKDIKGEIIQANHIKTLDLVANNAKIHDLCTDNILTSTLRAELLNADNACLKQASIENLCVNTLNVQKANICSPIRATVAFSTDTTYTLGTDINWDVILDDPNGNVTLSPAEYHVPVSGYYLFTLQVDQNSLVTPSPILGVPVGSPQVWVNGVEIREGLFPFLTFSNQAENTFTALISLKAGDIVTSRYSVFALSNAGFMTIPGTVIVTGNGTEAHHSVFKIVLLAADCQPVPCTPCPQIPTITCIPGEPVHVDCSDCDPCHRPTK